MRSHKCLQTLSQTFRPTLNHSPKIKDTLLAWERERERGREGETSSSGSLLLFHSLPLSLYTEETSLLSLHSSVSTVQLVLWLHTVTRARLSITRIVNINKGKHEIDWVLLCFFCFMSWKGIASATDLCIMLLLLSITQFIIAVWLLWVYSYFFSHCHWAIFENFYGKDSLQQHRCQSFTVCGSVDGNHQASVQKLAMMWLLLLF